MFEQTLAEQNLRNYSQEAEYEFDWFQKNSYPKFSIKKSSSSGKLATNYRLSYRDKPSNHHIINPNSARQNQTSQKEEIKKCSLPQIAFPLLGGSTKSLQQHEPTKNQTKMLATKILHQQPKTQRSFPHQYIHRLIEKQTEKIRASENVERNIAKGINFISQNFQNAQQCNNAFKNHKSLRKTIKMRKNEANPKIHIKKVNRNELQKQLNKKITLIDFFEKLS